MNLPFDETKATQVASRILKMRGGRMHYLKLIKLLYIIDREALQRWGFPVTTDRHVSMDHGPVVSRIYKLIVEEEIAKPQWGAHISPPVGDGYEVELMREASTDRLSAAEEKLIDEVYEKYGYMNRWKLRDLCHGFPEWNDPQGTSIPISIREILKAGGHDDEEIRATVRELRAMATAEEAFRA